MLRLTCVCDGVQSTVQSDEGPQRQMRLLSSMQSCAHRTPDTWVLLGLSQGHLLCILLNNCQRCMATVCQK